MSLLRNTLEGGTNGTAVSAANSGGASGDAFSAVSANQLFATAQKHEGAMSANVTAAGFLQWSFPDATNMAGRAYTFQTAGNAGANSDPIGFYLANGDAILAARINSGNQLRLYHGISTNFIWTPDFAIPLNQWIRWELLLEQGTTNANGRARLALYANNSPTPLIDSGWITGLDLGAASAKLINRSRWGAYATSAGTAYIDDLALNTAVDYTGFIGATSPELPTPVVTVSAKANPTTAVSTDGSITVTWPTVAGAHHYESDLQVGNVTTGFVADDLNAVSPKTYNGLAAGQYTVAVRAIAPV